MCAGMARRSVNPAKGWSVEAYWPPLTPEHGFPSLLSGPNAGRSPSVRYGRKARAPYLICPARTSFQVYEQYTAVFSPAISCNLPLRNRRRAHRARRGGVPLCMSPYCITGDARARARRGGVPQDCVLGTASGALSLILFKESVPVPPKGKTLLVRVGT